MGTIQSIVPVGPIRKNVMFEGVEYFNGDGTADIGFQFDNGSPISLIV